MAGQYSYPPPPPPPAAASPNAYPAYGPGQPYTHSPTPPRGGSAVGNGGAGRARGYTQGHNRADHQSTNGYWSGNPQAHNAPLPQTNYHPNYAPQGYPPQPHNAYPPSAYPANSQQASYTPAYSSPTPEYGARQWSETGSPYSPYSNRGGRGGYSGDRGGQRGDQSTTVMRMGYDQNSGHTTQASNGYGQQYPPPPQQHAPVYMQTPQYSSYPPAPAPAYSGPAHNTYSHNRGRGRDGFSGQSRGRTGQRNDRGDKFHHKGQRPQHDHNQPQKSDNSSAKKKKRKTNTLGLTPGDGDESDDGSVDEEKQLVELLGIDAPVVPDIATWIAERKANYPTRDRVEAKKAAEQATRAEVGEDQKPVTKLTKDEEKAEKLRRELAKVERKLEKRKRETIDEGDEMRIDGAKSESSESEDDKPEVQSIRKPSSFLPPPPITRADPTNHCKYYSTGGICGKKGKCRFVHDKNMREQALQEQAANGGRITLKQRLLRNDKEQEDLAVVQSIVNLRASGKLVEAKEARGAATHSLSTLPAKPHFLPPTPALPQVINRNPR
ncbi:hypothetical protein BJ170DRAFT_8489 [Xylariales sp. AK1849]|nr:hypothetical protein BJ170DRAFT_8489 [Xylariales sp. AK1849]